VSKPEAGTNESALSAEGIAELVKSLASAMRQSDISELDLAAGSVSVRLRRAQSNVNSDQPPPSELKEPIVSTESNNRHVITAPMIGTFYVSPTPGTSPFISEGDDVFIGQTIGIIEAMKIMNEIAADRSGTVEAVLVSNGQPVEYGSPLFQLAQTRGDRL
jgi:acetyl-CoA carboxylase biotin carboxyl carrier protein